MLWFVGRQLKNGQQNIYIAKMKNCSEIQNRRVLIASPEYTWKLHRALGRDARPCQVNLNGGLHIPTHAGRVSIVFSAGGC